MGSWEVWSYNQLTRPTWLTLGDWLEEPRFNWINQPNPSVECADSAVIWPCWESIHKWLTQPVTKQWCQSWGRQCRVAAKCMVLPKSCVTTRKFLITISLILGLCNMDIKPTQESYCKHELWLCNSDTQQAPNHACLLESLDVFRAVSHMFLILSSQYWQHYQLYKCEKAQRGRIKKQ